MKKNFLFKWVSVLGAILLLATTVMPGLQYAYAQSEEPATPPCTMTTDIGEKIFNVGDEVEFSFSTVKNTEENYTVKGTSTFSDNGAIDKLWYYANGQRIEYPEGDFWVGNWWWGFPLSNATATFKIKFKKPGNLTFTASMETVDGDNVLCTTSDIAFTVNAEAKIWDKEYKTLADAITAVTENDTITLLKDVEYNNVIAVENDFTFDFNWHTITTTVKNFFTVNGWKKLTINDNTNSVTKGWINSTQGGIFKVTNWSVEINWWKFKWLSVLIVNWSTASATVNDGDFEWQNSWNSTAIQATKWATITIYDWTFKAGLNNPSNKKPQKVIYAWDDSNPCSSTSNTNMEWWIINVNGWYFEWRLSRSNWWEYHIHWWTFKVLPDPTDANFSTVWITAWVGCNYDYCEGKNGDEPLSCQKIIGIAPMLEGWYYAEKVEGEDDTYKVKNWNAVKVEFKNDSANRKDVILYIKKWEKIGQNKPTDPTAEEWKTFAWIGSDWKIYTTDSVINSDTVLTAKWWYTIALSPVSNGTIVSNPELAEENEIVTLTATPASNYNFSSWTAKDANDGDIEVSNNAFTMPASNVTVSATFTKKPASYSWGGGSSSSKKTETTKEEDAKANTWDTAKLDETTANENANEENKNEGSNTDGATATPEEFSQEFIDAYNFAYKNGITTKESIEEAEMFEPLTRIAMAKMLSQYAINVLGQTPDTTVVVPTFPDVDEKLDADYNNWVTLAYQLWIMWIGIEEFRPFAEVTRAEFGTALSRMLFGLADGEWAEWYKTHLDKLMNEQIITNDNPNIKELRGYVMIMLMSSAQ